jgi:branched-chain amino acid transport system substrate-binding protein
MCRSVALILIRRKTRPRLPNLVAWDIVVVARQDDYGQALNELLVDELEAGGADVVANPIYDPEAASFESEVEEIAGADPDAVIFISFDEVGEILAGVIERGLTPDQFYGADGTFSPTLFEVVDETDPNVVDGMTVIGAAGDDEFNARIAEDTGNNFIYGGQYYDCVVITALAAEAAGSVDGQAIVD